MSAYLVARMAVKDADKLADYSKQAASLIAAYGGKLLFKGGAEANLFGQMDMPNMAVFIFPDLEKITEFYHSPEYQALAPLRQTGAEMVLSAHQG